VSTPYCNTTSGSFVILRELIAGGHDHGGFFGPVAGTGDIRCVCGISFSRAELTAPVPEAVAG
jgi:hypothetical protein